MAEDRGDQPSDNKNGNSPTAGQQSHESEYGQQHGQQDSQETMDNQGAEGSFGGESSGNQSGSADPSGSAVPGGESDQDDGMRGQPIGGNDSNTGTGTTLTQGADFPEGANLTGKNSENEGFIGSKASGSDDYVEERNSSLDSDEADEPGRDSTEGSSDQLD